MISTAVNLGEAKSSWREMKTCNRAYSLTAALINAGAVLRCSEETAK